MLGPSDWYIYFDLSTVVTVLHRIEMIHVYDHVYIIIYIYMKMRRVGCVRIVNNTIGPLLSGIAF